MANLREIRDRISSVKNTQQITKAMKMVAAARLRKAQDRLIATRPYAATLSKVVSKLATGDNAADNRYLNPISNPEKILLIIIGSDRGLCGGFNTNLFRYIEDRIKSEFSKHIAEKTLELICIGRKANDHFRKRGYNVIESHIGFFDKLNFESTASIMRNAAKEFESAKYDAVFVGFNEFKSVISQNRVMQQVLPIQLEEVNDDENAYGVDYIYEPSDKEILERILPLHLNTQMWRAVLESNASEQGARMAAMDNATENASEIMRQLKLKYNQARQAAITTEISEIVSGAEALNN
ncbi:MAG: ATP synthase F1 subunit gamma [Bacteroidetes bacterium]|nr:ATP synthase F1 subunit gamma [Bacteroidota bacterium]MCH8523446.1 ATP synthase F1 subunit gamma [Balneolales bacterium]